MYVICPRDETPWHVRTGLCRFNRTSSLPTYKVRMENEDLIITI
jgi:nitrite reductase/ring-hydroxylating ferredoxin subunit